MEKQYNLLLSLPVILKQTLFLKHQSEALLTLLKKFSDEQINQTLPQAIQEYLNSPEFTKESAAQARKVLEKQKKNFLDNFSKYSGDFEILGNKIQNMFLCVDQTKKNIQNGISFACQTCKKAYPTMMGLNYHKKVKHSNPQNESNESEEFGSQRQQRASRRDKKIRKPRRQTKARNQSQKSSVFEPEEYDYLL